MKRRIKKKRSYIPPPMSSRGVLRLFERLCDKIASRDVPIMANQPQSEIQIQEDRLYRSVLKRLQFDVTIAQIVVQEKK